MRPYLTSSVRQIVPPKENLVPVLALREGSAVLVEGESAKLLGPAKRSPEVTWEGAMLFTPGEMKEVPRYDILYLSLSTYIYIYIYISLSNRDIC